VHIRRATLADARRIRRIAAGELLIDVPDFHWHTSAEITRAIRNDEYFVAVLEGRITGILCLRQDGDTLWIETIAVTREHQRKGQGRALVRFAVERAAQLGLPWVRVSTFAQYGAEEAYRRTSGSSYGSPTFSLPHSGFASLSRSASPFSYMFPSSEIDCGDPTV
jgi:GNAT superfamily N-acetyltransferase